MIYGVLTRTYLVVVHLGFFLQKVANLNLTRANKITFRQILRFPKFFIDICLLTNKTNGSLTSYFGPLNEE